MDRRRFLQVSAASFGLALRSSAWALPDNPPDHVNARSLFVYVDSRLGSAGRALFEFVRSSKSSSPLLAALAADKDIQPLEMINQGVQVSNQLAYNHIILIGHADDPLVEQAWQMEAKIYGDDLYAFGFGNLRGSLGYIESDRNPFLHAASVPKAPYECQLITLTGTDPAGISLAVSTFVKQGLSNGIVSRFGAWKRGQETLLDCDPLAADFTVPASIPANLGTLAKIAVTQVSEDEYRGVLADAGHVPVSMWRAKYYKAGQWDGAGELVAFNNYAAGLHRRAYGNSVLLAIFASEAIAHSAAPLMAKAARLTQSGSIWKGGLPPYAWGLDWMGDSSQPGTLELAVHESSILLASQLRTV